KTACSNNVTNCIDGGSTAAGTSCGVGMVCDGNGARGAFRAGQACTPHTHVSKTGMPSCATGAQTCADDANKPGGTACGSNMVCNGSGACITRVGDANRTR